jgi:integrase/recombinase XerD
MAEPAVSESNADAPGGAQSPLQQDIAAYLVHLKIERNLAKNSLNAYRSDLAALAHSLETQGVSSARELTEGPLYRTLAEHNQNGLSSRSMSRRVSALRGFLRYLHDEGKVTEELEERLPKTRSGRRLPRPAQESEMVDLLRAPDLTTPRGRRDRAILSLTYAAGLRASEVVSLTLGDLDLDRGTVSTLGKGNKRRLVPLGQLALADVSLYLADRLNTKRSKTARPLGSWLFPGANSKPLTRQAFWKIVRGCGLRAGLSRPIHPHVLRHSFASHLIQGGADLRSVQLLLGHESITTTEIYTHVSSEHVRRAFEKSHPRA